CLSHQSKYSRFPMEGTMFLRRHWSHASWLLPLLSLSAQGHGAELTVSEDDPRALATISQHIAQHTRSVITYEELAFEYQGDLQLYPDKNPAHALPQHKRFTFSYDPTVDVEETLEALIASYNAQSSGSYKLVEADGVFHILPDTSKDESGTLTQRASILDLPVSVQLSDETGGEVACE